MLEILKSFKKSLRFRRNFREISATFKEILYPLNSYAYAPIQLNLNSQTVWTCDYIFTLPREYNSKITSLVFEIALNLTKFV